MVLFSIFLPPGFLAAFDEDRHLLEKIQAQVSADPTGLDYLEVTLGADGAGIRVRQTLKRVLEAEGKSLTGEAECQPAR